jgi:hypothetical protein
MITIYFWIFIIILTAYAGFKFWILIEERIHFRKWSKELELLIKNISAKNYTEEEVKNLCSRAWLKIPNDPNILENFDKWFEQNKKKS